MSPDYERQIREIVRPIYVGKSLVDRTLNTRAEAKAYIAEVTLVEKQLRSLRREISATMREIRTTYASKRTNASEHALYGRLAGRQKAIHLRAQERDALLREQHAKLAPHEAAVQAIDRFLLLFDHVKVEVNKGILAGEVEG